MKTLRSYSSPGCARRALAALSFSFSLAAASSLAGCAGSSDRMRPAAANAPLAPAAGEATLVFLRPARLGYVVNFSIYDAKGTFFGDAVAASYFAVRLPPGGYTILAEGENVSALYAHVAAGKTYYVEVVPRVGWLRARVGLEALRRGHPDLPNVATWLRGRRLELAEGFGTAATWRSGASLAEQVAEAKREWDALDPAEKQHRTLHPDDGF